MIDSLRPSAAPASAPQRSAAPTAAGTGASATRTRNLVIEAATAPAGTPAAGTSATPPAAATPSSPAAAPSLSLPIVFEPNSAQLRLKAAQCSAASSPRCSPRSCRTSASSSKATPTPAAPAQNLRLRASAPSRCGYLVTLGVAGERLRAVGKGASDPVNAADPRAAENRRAASSRRPDDKA
ncbi:MAG: hypothetical protein U1F25_15085 [Rubrivivax sp.]